MTQTAEPEKGSILRVTGGGPKVRGLAPLRGLFIVRSVYRHGVRLYADATTSDRLGNAFGTHTLYLRGPVARHQMIPGMIMRPYEFSIEE